MKKLNGRKIKKINKESKSSKIRFKLINLRKSQRKNQENFSRKMDQNLTPKKPQFLSRQHEKPQHISLLKTAKSKNLKKFPKWSKII